MIDSKIKISKGYNKGVLKEKKRLLESIIKNNYQNTLSRYNEYIEKIFVKEEYINKKKKLRNMK